ncbi:hypothetical protein [Streptomyces sp. NPDC001621]|uniref:hypothetical protein n=1 Tax=Streptomyces sp. NPDC001621 TaxID=3364594 RepID=UPI0036B66D11
MPRNRPGALHAPHGSFSARPRTAPPPPRVHGLSARTSLAVNRAEADVLHLRPGSVDRALRRCEGFLAAPGQSPLYPTEAYCASCPGCALDDVREAMSLLAQTLAALPPRPRSELARLLAPLRRRYLARTLPDPFADRTLPWWHRRLAHGVEGW